MTAWDECGGNDGSGKTPDALPRGHRRGRQLGKGRLDLTGQRFPVGGGEELPASDQLHELLAEPEASHV